MRRLPSDVPRTALGKHGELGRLVAQLWDLVRTVTTGDPGIHHLTHMVGGSDQFPAPDPPSTVKAGGSAAAGSGPGFMRADAQLIVGTAVPANPTGAAAAAGVASTVLRSDATIQQGIVSAKGDLLGFTTVPAKIPVGTDGHVLTADSAVAAGVKWAASSGGGGGGGGSGLSPVDGSNVDSLENHLVRQSIESYALRNVLATTFR